MSKPYTMRRATQADYPAVMKLLNDRRKWLRGRGSDQWNVGREFESRIADSIRRRDTWVMTDEGAPIATITVSQQGDPDFWTTVELDDKALYIGKMATNLDRSRENIGALLVKWAQDRASRLGLKFVRWDAWRTNINLHNYYRSVGARYIRTEEVIDRQSGTLFELNAEHVDGLDKDLLTL